MELKLTPLVLFRAIGAVAGQIGPKCEAAMMRAAQGASAEDTRLALVDDLTPRDYFAAHAPTAPDDFGWASGECDSWQRNARWAYVYADAMLAARCAA